MNRRKFLKFLGVSLAAVGVANMPVAQIEKLADQMSNSQKKKLMRLAPNRAGEVVAKSFNDMLKEYLPIELLQQELMKRDYLLNKIAPDDAFRGATIQIPLGYKDDAV